MIIQLSDGIRNFTELQKLRFSKLLLTAVEGGHYIDISYPNLRWFEQEFLDKENKLYYGTLDQELMLEVLSQSSIPALLSRSLSLVSIGENPDGDKDLDALEAVITKESQVIVENGTNDWSVVRRWIYLYRKKGEFRDVNRLVYDQVENGCLDAVNAGGNGGIVNEAKRLSPRFKGMHGVKMFSIFDCDKQSVKDMDHNLSIKTELDSLGIGWHELQKRAMENYFDWESYVALGCVEGDRPAGITEEEWDFIDVESFINENVDPSKRKKKYLKSMLVELSERLTKQSLNGRLAHIEQTPDEVQSILLRLARII